MLYVFDASFWCNLSIEKIGRKCWYARPMPRRRPRDVNELGKRLVDEATGLVPVYEPSERDAAAVARGKARAEKMTPEERADSARKAALARWASRKKA